MFEIHNLLVIGIIFYLSSEVIIKIYHEPAIIHFINNLENSLENMNLVFPVVILTGMLSSHR